MHLVNNIKQSECVCLCAFGSPRAFSIFVVAFEQKSLETTGVSYCIKRITRPQRDTTEAERERLNATIAWQLIAFKSPTLSIDVSCVLSNLIFTFYERYTTFVLFYRFFFARNITAKIKEDSARNITSHFFFFFTTSLVHLLRRERDVSRYSRETFLKKEN